MIGQVGRNGQGAEVNRVLDYSPFFSNGMPSIPECPFSSFLLLHFSLFLPPSLNFSLLFPREPKINTRLAFVKGKHSSHPSRGCDQLCLGWSTKVFWQLFFLLEMGPLLECALLLSSWEFRSSPHRTQFNLQCSVSHLLQGIGGMITEVVVNNQCTNLGV